MVMLFEDCMLREMKSLRVKGTAVEEGKANKIQCVTITRCSCRHFRCKTFVNDCTVAAEVFHCMHACVIPNSFGECKR